MSSPVIDYSALADQARKVQPSVDYAALADQVRSGAATRDVVPGTEKLGGVLPGVPKPPIPYGLQTDEQKASAPDAPTFQNPRTGARHVRGLDYGKGPLGIVDNPMLGAGRIAEGVEQAAQPGMLNKAGGASKIIRGTMQAATPLLPGAAAAAPAATAAGLITGSLSGSGTEAGLNAAGVDPEYSALAGDVAGIAAGGRAASRSASLSRAQQMGRSIISADPTVAMVRALKPTPTESGFTDRLPDTLSHIKKAGGDVRNNADLISATKKAIDSHQSALEAWMEPSRRIGAAIAGDPIAAAAEKSIPSSTRLENPQEAAAISENARNAYAGRTFSVDEMRQLLREKNAELKGFYDRAQGKQNAAIMSGKPESVVKAERDSIAGLLYNTLDPENAGAGPRSIQQQTGDMMEILEAAQRRKNSIIAEKPVSKIGGAARAVAGVADLPGKILHGEIEEGFNNIHGAMSGTSDPLIARAFSGVGDAKPLPTPGKPPTIQGLLEAGARRMGPTPDASGPIPSEPSRNPGFWTPRPKKTALPGAPIVTEPPPDTSGIRVTTGAPLMAPPSRQIPSGPSVRSVEDLSGRPGDITDMVPIKNADGSITYIPRAGRRFAMPPPN